MVLQPDGTYVTQPVAPAPQVVVDAAQPGVYQAAATTTQYVDQNNPQVVFQTNYQVSQTNYQVSQVNYQVKPCQANNLVTSWSSTSF